MTAPGQTPDVRLAIKAEPRLLGAVRGAVRAYLAGAGIEGEKLDDAVLAVDEACTNCIRHAYGGDTACVYTVEMSKDAHGILVAVVDEGEPCPRSKLKKRDMTPPDLGELTPGGLGIQLIHRVFDEVSYASNGTDGNRMEMRLKRNTP